MRQSSKTYRELNDMLIPLGYEFQGVNGNGHFVYRHGETGAIARFSSQNMKTPRLRQNSRLHAERAIRHAQSASQLWVDFLMNKFNVGERDEKQIQFSMKDMTDEFMATHPGLRISRGLPGIVLANNPLFERIRPGSSTTPAVWKVRGPLFGVKPFVDPADETEAESEPAAAAVTVPEPVPATDAGLDDPAMESGAGDDPAVAVAGAGGAEDDRGAADGEQLVAAAAAGPGASYGLIIPEDLAGKLREALSGDLLAERDILRDSLVQVAASLQAAMEAVSAALSVTTEGHGQYHRRPERRLEWGGGIGPRTIKRYELLKANREQLGDLITTEKAHAVLTENGIDLTPAATSGTLWKLGTAGWLVRLGGGVYRWPEG